MINIYNVQGPNRRPESCGCDTCCRGESRRRKPTEYGNSGEADRDSSNVPGIPRNGTFRILAQAPASTIPATPTTTSASTPTHPAGDRDDRNSEAHTNTTMRKIKCAYASNGEPISCAFENPMNDIVQVNVTTTIHVGDICAIVDVFEGTSASVEDQLLRSAAASDMHAVPAPVDSPAAEPARQPPEQTMPTKPSAKATLQSIPGCSALPGLIGLVIACLLR